MFIRSQIGRWAILKYTPANDIFAVYEPRLYFDTYYKEERVAYTDIIFIGQGTEKDMEFGLDFWSRRLSGDAGYLFAEMVHGVEEV